MVIGVWLSPVECLVRDQEAAGSNPVTPIMKKDPSWVFFIISELLESQPLCLQSNGSNPDVQVWLSPQDVPSFFCDCLRAIHDACEESR